MISKISGLTGHSPKDARCETPCIAVPPPPIYSGKNLKIKGLHGHQSHVRLYFQDSKSEEVFPHFGENSMLRGIRWLSGIGENFRLTRNSAGFGVERRCKIVEKNRVSGNSNSGTALACGRKPHLLTAADMGHAAASKHPHKIKKTIT